LHDLAGHPPPLNPEIQFSKEYYIAIWRGFIDELVSVFEHVDY
jgi:hypothetical protein